MRFEEMSHFEEIKCLQRIHNRLNQDIFNSKLNKISIDIEHRPWQLDKQTAASFDRKYTFYDFKTHSNYIGERIAFYLPDGDEVDPIESCKTQKQQALYLAELMLHEMIHQYCYENGIDAENHGGRWAEVAAEHGLISTYENGKLVEEHLDSRTADLFAMFYTRL